MVIIQFKKYRTLNKVLKTIPIFIVFLPPLLIVINIIIPHLFRVSGILIFLTIL